MSKVAVILSGSGFMDGAEIHESVLTLLALSHAGAQYQCFAPNRQQMHVVNHVTGEPTEDKRNVMEEAARIARGNIQPLEGLNVDDFDAIIFPGGFGVAKNFSDFATKGPDYAVESDISGTIQAFIDAKKPAGFACIAPALIPQLYPEDVQFTIGNDKDVASALTQKGGEHVDTEVNEVVIDKKYRVASTPAYMFGDAPVHIVAQGIHKMVSSVLEMC
tara:strand:+ start:53 stop:706 length:654 start_codon:yes stop_codon:yes gene_type:complete